MAYLHCAEKKKVKRETASGNLPGCSEGYETRPRVRVSYAGPSSPSSLSLQGIRNLFRLGCLQVESGIIQQIKEIVIEFVSPKIEMNKITKTENLFRFLFANTKY